MKNAGFHHIEAIKMVIFDSYVKLPEGICGVYMIDIH